MSIDVKICGIRTPEALQAAVTYGARYVGLVFYPPSPRAVDPGLAAQLARQVPTGVRVVGLFVDPQDEEVERTLRQVPLDMIQLHGSETPARIRELRSGFSGGVIKALPIGGADDLLQIGTYRDVADCLLFDAKPPKNVTSLPGGNALSFDWRLLTEVEIDHPWMLAGGLTAENLATAVTASGATAVDVSSGVETRPGHKDPDLIRAFLTQAKQL